MKLLRKVMAGLLAAGIVLVPTPAPVYAANWIGGMIVGAINMASVRKQLIHLDNNAQEEVLQRTMQDTGYYDNPAYQQRAQHILNELVATGIPKREYVIYVNPDENINAFCTLAAVLSVNKGTLDTLNDDELAFVLAHEISHGEHRDIVDGATKKMGVSVAAQTVLNGSDAGAISALLMNIGTNFVKNEVFTMGQERDADDLGFKILAASPYNPGGAAASMATLLAESGDHYRDGITRVIAPNTHPRTKDRVDDAVKRLYSYSGKHVSVENAQIVVNNHKVFQPAASGDMPGEIRAYYVAGKLARLFHNNELSEAYISGNRMVMSGVSLYSFSPGENAQQIVDDLNAAIYPKKNKVQKQANQDNRVVKDKKDKQKQPVVKVEKKSKPAVEPQQEVKEESATEKKGESLSEILRRLEKENNAKK